MKLGDGVEAAIHCTTMLAGLQGGAVMPASALAEYHGVSASYLVKHLKQLVAAGVFVSIPGPAGGYRLGRAPQDITLLDIVLAVEGDAPAFRCREIRQRGPDAPDAFAFPNPCGIKLAMLRAEEAYRAALAETRISSLIRDYSETGDPRDIARGCRFVEANRRP
ncbi:Rrf2 family transcriptional regulator [Ruegeria sp. 2012CJ41-6]|uniref:Rrf2 family transcriptional regulator n=1 Tax=Ruegeria spongiae TaxID=2942209 RepID=A0ABT0PYG4_9RHOB|nr:Rrf2 family transcriptional regulator [Ruegeria spongiae]MCL6282212.1 Rrf2 family transcriptional regulator [Ruegeria spongiae]